MLKFQTLFFMSFVLWGTIQGSLFGEIQCPYGRVFTSGGSAAGQAGGLEGPNSPPKFTHCGFGLAHSAGLCVHPNQGAEIPENGTSLLLFPHCDQHQARLRFSILSNGSLYHVSSGKCIHPEGGKAEIGRRLVFWSSCSDGPVSDANGNKRLAFEFTSSGSIRHKNTGLCIHPSGGLESPENDTELVLWSGCDERRLQFIKLPFH
jgi:hypothetical protein